MTGLRLRLAAAMVLLLLAAGLWLRYRYLEHALERERRQTEQLQSLRKAERAKAEAKIFSAEQLAKLRKEEPDEAIDLSRGLHVLDF